MDLIFFFCFVVFMRINDVKSVANEEQVRTRGSPPASNIPVLITKEDHRQLLATLFNRNYYDTDDQLQEQQATDLYQNSIEYVS
jgi:hypothetical protein